MTRLSEPDQDRVNAAYMQLRLARTALASGDVPSADAHVATARALLSVVARVPAHH